MMRLTWMDGEDRERRLLVEGEIVGDGSELLESECARVSQGGRPSVLDLSGTTHVDRSGIDALQRLVARGFRIVGENPLIAEVRKGGGWQ